LTRRRWSARRSGGCARGTRAFHRRCRSVDTAEDIVGHGHIAIILGNLAEHAGMRSGHFEDDLVGFQFNQDFVLLDGVTNRFSP
jgi:hypothetical protein